MHDAETYEHKRNTLEAIELYCAIWIALQVDSCKGWIVRKLFQGYGQAVGVGLIGRRTSIQPRLRQRYW